MKLINNFLSDIHKIKGFTEKELLEIKQTLLKFKSEKSDQIEIDEFLKTKFSDDIIEYYLNYIKELRSFCEQYLIAREDLKMEKKFNYYHLKSRIIDEIKKCSNNLVNLKLNSRNTKRFLKNNAFLNEFLTAVQELLDENDDLISKVKNSLKKVERIYDNNVYIWIEANKIKNFKFKFNDLPSTLEKWDEFKQLYDFIENINVDTEKKKKKKERILISTFNEIYHFYNKKQQDQIEIYTDLIVLLFQNNIIEEVEVEEIEDFVNIVEKKEIVQKLQNLMSPIISTLIEDKLKDILNEIIEIDEKFPLENEKSKINLKNLWKQKINIFFPKLVDYYFNGLEKKYNSVISDLKESDEIKKILKRYEKKCEIFLSILNEFEDWILHLEPYLKPYEEDTFKTFKKALSNVSTEIDRKKNDYLYYLKTIKNEKLRDNIRNYVNEKISDLNKLLSSYQDETSAMINEEFPQFKQIRKILNEYKVKIKKIKEEVYKKLDLVKEKDIDIYQIIKQWENNFTIKKQQLNFLISLVFNKLFKNFREIIEEEDVIFDNITKITEQNENSDNVPLNFSLSHFLAKKLTEEELNERITEMKSKITKLNKEINLYKAELSNLEETLVNKVRLREGISTDSVQCGVCFKYINFAEGQIIKCPFCGAIYHYLCVAFWLSKHNSCPSCQNVFLDPNAGIYKNDDI